MASPSALQPGVYYHIYNRGVNRQDIFVEPRNYAYFLQLYARYVEPAARTYAYCLLPNHFHALIWTKTEQELQETLRVSKTLRVYGPSHLSRQLSHLFNAYAKAINKSYGRTGSLFQHPYGRVPITTESHLLHLVAYIHQNPQRHGLIDDFRAWPHSSYAALMSKAPTRVERDAVLEWFGGLAGAQAFHLQPLDGPAITPFVPDDFD